jgi:PIN domain nuclease of toxin-antitoxin system
VAERPVQLDDFRYPDPAGRLIIATALLLDAPIVMKDSKIHDYSRVKAVW